MPDAIPIVLWSWVPISLLLFWKLPPARAAVACLLGGWLFLPTARFADSAAVDFPYWIMPSAVPADYWTTKARIIGLAGLLGVMAFDPGAWRRFRPLAADLPILGWCLCPLVSGLLNGRGMAWSVADTAYQAMAWGVPYLMGRLYFATPSGLDELARGVVLGGLAYLPLCLIELATGPILYAGLYGFHPYQSQGATRYLGYRPIVFLEDGNQLGIWLASSALVAVWLARAGRLDSLVRLPGWLVAGFLVIQAVGSQSAGAVALLAVGLGSMEVVRRFGRVWPLSMVLVLVMLFMGARAINLVDAKALVMKTGIGRRLVDASTRLDRRSIGWRLRVEERAAKVALSRPILGWGSWDWWRAGPEGERPWGLLSLALGMYGLVGWAFLIGCFLAPIVSFLNVGPPRQWLSSSRASAAGLAVVLAVNGLDAILNPCLFLPVMAIAGGLVGLAPHVDESMNWLRRAGFSNA